MSSRDAQRVSSDATDRASGRPTSSRWSGRPPCCGPSPRPPDPMRRPPPWPASSASTGPPRGGSWAPSSGSGWSASTARPAGTRSAFGLIDLAGQAGGALARSARGVLHRLAVRTGETAALALLRDGVAHLRRPGDGRRRGLRGAAGPQGPDARHVHRQGAPGLLRPRDVRPLLGLPRGGRLPRLHLGDHHLAGAAGRRAGRDPGAGLRRVPGRVRDDDGGSPHRCSTPRAGRWRSSASGGRATGSPRTVEPAVAQPVTRQPLGGRHLARPAVRRGRAEAHVVDEHDDDVGRAATGWTGRIGRAVVSTSRGRRLRSGGAVVISPSLWRRAGAERNRPARGQLLAGRPSWPWPSWRLAVFLAAFFLTFLVIGVAGGRSATASWSRASSAGNRWARSSTSGIDSRQAISADPDPAVVGHHGDVEAGAVEDRAERVQPLDQGAHEVERQRRAGHVGDDQVVHHRVLLGQPQPGVRADREPEGAGRGELGPVLQGVGADRLVVLLGVPVGGRPGPPAAPAGPRRRSRAW